MVNPELERRFADCNELVEYWRAFLDLVNRGAKSPEGPTPELEQRFLQTKARIAMLHDSFMDSLKHDKQTGANMLGIVNRAITLRSLRKVSEAEAKKIEIEWHEVFLLLNETVSSVEEERNNLEKVNPIVWKMGKLAETAKVQSKSFLGSIYFKIIVVLSVLIFIIWGIPALGIYDYDKLRDNAYTKKPVAGLMKFARFTLGMNVPYNSVEEFVAEMTREKKPGFASFTDETGQRNKETAISQLLPRMQMAPSAEEAGQVSAILNNAAGYSNWRIASDAERDQGYVFIFYFRKTSDAMDFDRRFQDNKTRVPQEYDVVRKANVISIVQSTARPHVEAIKSSWLNPMPPNP